MWVKGIVLYRKLTFFTLAGFLITAPNGLAVENVYCIEYVFKILNGACVDEQFRMVPADNEYRMHAFKRFNVAGTARIHAALSDMNHYADLQTAARHDALCRLLVRKGQMSLESDRCVENNGGLDEIVIRYQGFVQYPFTLIDQGYRQEADVFEVEMQIRFASVASPERWPFLYRKKQLLKNLQAFRSWF